MLVRVFQEQKLGDDELKLGAEKGAYLQGTLATFLPTQSTHHTILARDRI